jgi:hypothetical protein
MTNQALALINDAFEAPNIKSLISKFSSEQEITGMFAAIHPRRHARRCLYRAIAVANIGSRLPDPLREHL